MSLPTSVSPRDLRGYVDPLSTGPLPARLELAARILSGFAADPNVNQEKADLALIWADKLLAAHNKSLA